MCYPAAQQKSAELEAAAQNEPPQEHEPLLRDAAKNRLCGRTHGGSSMAFVVAAEPPTEGTQPGLVPCLSFPQGSSAVCASGR